MPARKTLAGEDGATMPLVHPTAKANAGMPSAGRQSPHVLVWTRGYNNHRSYANLQETVLTPANVGGLRKLYSYPLPGDARGTEAQVLIDPQLKLSNGDTYDAAVIVTMANDVFVYDANSPQLLWEKNYGHPIVGTPEIDGWMVNQAWGVLSTPVLDKRTETLYFVTWTAPDGNWRNAVHTLEIISLTDGHELKKVPLTGVTYTPGHGLPVQRFAGSERKQRASLAFTDSGGHKTVFIPFGTILEVSAANRGWMIAYDVDSGQLTSWTATSHYAGGGIWSAGNPPVVRGNADGTADLFFVTGNGSFEPPTDWGECVLRLHYVPPSGIRAGSFTVADWWSPYSDSGRAGGDPTGTHITKDIGQGWDDMDLMTLAYLPEFNLLIASSKDGIGYVLDADHLGQTQPSDFRQPAANYAKAKWIGWLTYPSAMDLAQYGPPPTPTPNDFTKLNFLYAGLTHHEHAAMPWFKDIRGDYKLDVWGENGNLRCFHLGPDGQLTFLANGAEVASAESPKPPGGMAGGMLSLSANGTQNALLWAVVPVLDVNRGMSPGYFAIYDANNLQKYSDGTGAVKCLYKSPTYTVNKFDVITVSGSKAFVPTYSGTIDVYGLPN